MPAKLGLAFYGGPPDPLQPGGGPVLTDDNLLFARQLGATHVIQCAPGEHLLPIKDGVWQYEDLLALRHRVESFGLKLEAIENWHPTMWGHILLGRPGPQRDRQMAALQATIRNMGRAGIPTMGYYFSVAGPGAQILSRGPYGRGGAPSIGYLAEEVKGGPAGEAHPIPRGTAWSQQVIDGEEGAAGDESCTIEEMWLRLEWFLTRLVPVAEQAGVRLAAHPDDPPIPVLRGVGRMITHPQCYQRLLDIAPSWYNALEFCQGTISEMATAPGNALQPDASPIRDSSTVPSAIDRFAHNIAYVHFRNVVGQVPHYKEVFIDEGDVDMVMCLQRYKAAGYSGVFIPDHSPAVVSTLPSIQRLHSL
eukprot:SAG31_NODE_3034_length_4763_cov_8.243782_2_plen_363_part_00